MTKYNTPMAVLDFRHNHPEAYGLIAAHSLELKRRGARLSTSRVFEAVRVIPMSEQNDIPFKLNNSMGAAMARLLMAEYPELEGAFETCKAESDNFDFRAALREADKKGASNE